MGNGNRTRNRRSHSPVLCQLSYSHHLADYSNCGWRMSERLALGRIGFLPFGSRLISLQLQDDTKWRGAHG